MRQRYNDFGTWIRSRFPYRVQKLSVDAGFSCPNRDGRIGTGGCIYCDNRTFSPAYLSLYGNSGEASEGAERRQAMLGRMPSVAAQLEAGKKFFARKYPDMKYLCYFQSFTNTYAPLSTLRRLYEEALSVPDVVGIVVGTRPDCVTSELLDYLSSLSGKMVIVEYGIESTNDDTLRRINRGHDFECVRRAVEATHERGLLCGGHLIMGLPGESRDEIVAQAAVVSQLPIDILKLHQLQVIRGTRLEREYAAAPFPLFGVDDYIRLIADYIEHLRPSIVLERFVSQSPASLLVAPRWGLKNHEFTAKLEKHLSEHDVWQGKKYAG